MTIKEYLKTLKEKDIIVIEPEMSEIRRGNKQAYVNSVRNLLKLDPPALEYEYNGSSSVEAINGMEGKLIMYRTNTPCARIVNDYSPFPRSYAAEYVTEYVADHLSF